MSNTATEWKVWATSKPSKPGWYFLAGFTNEDDPDFIEFDGPEEMTIQQFDAQKLSHWLKDKIEWLHGWDAEHTLWAGPIQPPKHKQGKTPR